MRAYDTVLQFLKVAP